MKALFFKTLFSLHLLLSCNASDAKTELIPLQVGNVTLQVEVADDAEERNKGLMYRQDLPKNQGMLFVFSDEQPRSFWMKNTPLPLSIAFLDSSGKIVKIDDMKPYTTDHTQSLYPAAYVIETNKGWFSENGVEVGADVKGLPSYP